MFRQAGCKTCRRRLFVSTRPTRESPGSDQASPAARPFFRSSSVRPTQMARTAGQDDLAVEPLRKTLKIDPNFAHARFHLGQTYLRKRALAEAIAEFQRAVTLSPNFADFKGRLGYDYARAGAPPAARGRPSLTPLHRPITRRLQRKNLHPVDSTRKAVQP
jgi:tetratricopeptide (TPR) repeat protein